MLEFKYLRIFSVGESSLGARFHNLLLFHNLLRFPVKEERFSVCDRINRTIPNLTPSLTRKIEVAIFN